MHTNKNILEFCLSPDLGGLELCVLDYFNYFSSKTNTKLIVAKGKKLDTFLENNNKSVLKRNKLFPIIPAFKLAKFIDAHGIDVVHFHWTRDIATVILAKVLSKANPKVIQSRHMTMTRFKDDIYHKWLYKNIDTIHAVTQQVKDQLIKYIPQDIRPNIQKIYLGVQEREVSSDTLVALKQRYNFKDEFIVGIVGRIEDAKGQYILIDAINKLKKLNIKALIVGNTMDEEYLNSLKDKIKLMGIEKKIVFSGFTKEVNEHMRLCDVSVLATPKETFGLVVIESMINKVPVIAVGKGGPLEIIDDAKDGLFFDRSSDELAQKIQLIYNDAKLKEELSLNAYEKVKTKFDKDTQMKKMYKVINES